MTRTCLIVDDSRVVRKVARRILEAHGYAVAEAADGQLALEACRQPMPDCVLLDWNMPVMDGLELPARPACGVRAGQPAGGVLHHRERHGPHRPGDGERRAGIHHEAVRRGDPGRQAGPGRSGMSAALRSAAPGGRARVMVCDNSMVIRGAISRMLQADPAVEVVARVGNGQAALDELKRSRPDVVVLDIEMPVMDGMTALPLLLRADPGLRVMMASTLTTRGADIALRALRLGAADYLPKPSSIGTVSDDSFRRELLEKVKGLARLRHRAVAPPAPGGGPASPCVRRRPCRPGCWRSAVPPAGHRRCSRWSRAWADRCACRWC